LIKNKNFSKKKKKGKNRKPKLFNNLKSTKKRKKTKQFELGKKIGT
jgi:hypothetical protein